MLKFKITKNNVGVDMKELEITDFERQEVATYDVSVGNSPTVQKKNNKYTYKIWVKDSFNIQPNCHLSGLSVVTVKNSANGTLKKYKHLDDLVVTSISKENECFTFNVDKELNLNASKLYIETRYNIIQYIDNSWVMYKTDKEYINNLIIDNINIEKVSWKNNSVYGINERQREYNGELYQDNTLFYYTNSNWNVINLIGTDLEGCLNGNTIKLNSIYQSDTTTYSTKVLDKNIIYYTQEDYIYYECYPLHYFSDMDIEYSETTTSYGKDIVKNIKYPEVMLSYEKNENTLAPYIKTIKCECHVENDYQLCINCDTFNTVDKGELLSRFFPNGLEKYDGHIPNQEGELGCVTFTRNNIMCDKSCVDFKIFYDIAVNVVQIPISQKFENDLFHNDAIETNLIEKTKRKLINPITDMEKDVYVPVIQRNDSVEQINAQYDDCYKIIFNLHFREHRDDDNEEWKCERDCYWNGTKTIEKEYTINDEKVIKKVVDLKGRVYNFDIENEKYSKKNKTDYFSYYKKVPEKNPTSETTDNYDNPNKDKTNDYNLDNYSKYKELRDERNQLMEYQSDLLSFLGFSNDDVKYQKSKLKKSFLRISFYDSDNIANQNLLHTSTIFLDSGDLFAKYIKNIETTEEYKVIETFTVTSKKGEETNPKIQYKKDDIITANEYKRLSLSEQKKCIVNGELMAVVGNSFTKEEPTTVYNKVGLRVNREPMRKIGLSKESKKTDFGDNIDELERLRMSSQIVVTDKYGSNHSSEGFYFYNYKSNDNGVFPSDIYMRVEFNHAGYGRTIPFMMPYIRKNEENLKDKDPGYKRYTSEKRKNKIKTFDDICYDWSEIDIDNGIDKKYIKDYEDVGYGTVRYMKYCHIKWKYRYDKRTQKHIYYLDPDVYGDGVTSDNGHEHNIILNLYEGKIR